MMGCGVGVGEGDVTFANRFDKDTRACSSVLFRLIEPTHTHIETSTPQQNREVTVALRTADLEDICVCYFIFLFLFRSPVFILFLVFLGGLTSKSLALL